MAQYARNHHRNIVSLPGFARPGLGEPAARRATILLDAAVSDGDFADIRAGVDRWSARGTTHEAAAVRRVRRHSPSCVTKWRRGSLESAFRHLPGGEHAQGSEALLR